MRIGDLDGEGGGQITENLQIYNQNLQIDNQQITFIS